MLTGERSASLTPAQSIGLMIAIAMMSIVTLSGIIAWRAAGLDFHGKAKHGSDYKRAAHTVKEKCDWCLLVFFLLGIFASAFYIAQSAQ
jgi:hypothetical protein